MQMLKGSRKWAVLALAVGIIMPSLAVAHGFQRWWLRPPVEAVADVTFDPVDVKHASLSSFSVANRRLQSRTYTRLDDATTTATVDGGELTIAEITVTDPDTDTTVVVTLDPTTLFLNLFGSSFRATGTAEVTVGAGTPVVIPVQACGQINTSGDGTQYQLRAGLQGVKSTTTTAGYDVTLLALSLSGKVAVPVPPTTP